MWIVTTANTKYPSSMKNHFNRGDAFDDLRNATACYPAVITSPAHFVRYVRDKNAKVVSWTIERRVPKHVTQKINKPGYTVPLGFVFVTYDDGSTSAFCITRALLKP